MINYPDINKVRDNCQKIHAFGLGFIQVQLTNKRRIHLYTSLVRKTVMSEEVHNHRYNFTSRVMHGELTNQIFSVTPDLSKYPKFGMCDETCKEGSVPTEAQPVKMSQLVLFELKAGQGYHLMADAFHRVFAEENTVTILEWYGTVKDTAQVVRTWGAEKICPFSVNMPETELWEIYREAVNESA